MEEKCQVGGGSVPTQLLDTIAVGITAEGRSTAALEAALRTYDTPIIARISRDVLLLDMCTVRDDQLEVIAAALQTIE